MTSAVEILIDNLTNVLSVPVEAVVEQGDKFYCWVEGTLVPERRPVILGKSNNTRIEVKDGLAEGDEVLKNPRRAMVAEARAEQREEQKVDVKARFGDDKPVQLPPVDRRSGGGMETPVGDRGIRGPRGGMGEEGGLLRGGERSWPGAPGSGLGTSGPGTPGDNREKPRSLLVIVTEQNRAGGVRCR